MPMSGSHCNSRPPTHTERLGAHSLNSFSPSKVPDSFECKQTAFTNSYSAPLLCTTNSLFSSIPLLLDIPAILEPKRPSTVTLPANHL